MSDAQSDLPSWRKSTASGSGNCVEVKKTGESVHVRDSKDPAGLHLTFTRPAWEAFLTRARSGELDLSLLPE